ncbi:arginine kinase Oct f 2 [Argonauta hians]
MAEAEAEQLYQLLQNAKDSHSLLKKHLTKERLDKLKGLKSKFGGTLADCIRSGCKNPESGVGIYASDPDAYTVFAEVLDAVIMDYHKIDKVMHPTPNFGDINNLNIGDLDPSGKLIVSTRVRVGRSHDSFGFPPVLTKEDRIKMEKVSVEALKSLEGELAGNYFPLTGMAPDVQKQMTEDHFLFNDSDRFLKAASGYDDWPTGRGIYFSNNKTFLCWVNEEDHLRLISMQKGGNLGEVYTRLVKAIHQMETKLKFAKKDNMGYLTFCPSNLGTTMRASVHIKIPKLSQRSDFKSICDSFNLQARGIHGEHTESVGGVYDISNKRRMGLTEFEAVTEMMKGVNEIIRQETSM